MTRKKPKEERKQEIVSAAIKEFLDKGYDGTTMEGIAKAANLSKGAVYHHFQGKDQVLVYAGEKLSEPIIPIFYKASREGSSAKGLNGFISDYLNYWKYNEVALSFYFLAMIKAFQHKELSSMFDYSEKVYPVLTELFRKGLEKEEFREHDPQGRAIALMSSLDGLLAYILLDENLSVDKIIKQYQEVYVNDLLKHP